MGLDMYAWAVKPEDVIDDLNVVETAEKQDFHYWRKHHDLHGWMENLYRQRGGENSFNCVPVRLYEKDLDTLERVVKRSLLPETTGFFFGNNPPDEESIADDMEFINDARDRIKDGFAVYYSSWW